MPTEPEYKSRSQKKRESTALQQHGESLAALSSNQLRKMDLPPALLEALLELKTMTKHEARRRQLQYVGKLMRQLENPDAIITIVSTQAQQQQEDAALLHTIEKIRFQLLSPDPAENQRAFSLLESTVPSFDRQKLQQLVVLAQKEHAEQKTPKQYRELFRYIRCLLSPPENVTD